MTSSSDVWCLAPRVHAVAASGDFVFLDVMADAYSCLPGGARDLRLTPDARGVSIANAALATELQAAGLIAPCGDPTGASGRRWPPPPRVSAVRTHNAPPVAGDLWQALQASGDVFFNYRGRSFSELIDLAARYPIRDVRDAPALVEIVDQFHRWVPYTPVSGKCLLRAFMLLRLLRRHGLDARWVFGVTTWPFRAHCWLQDGETVLDDSLEHLAPFHPILVV